MKTTLTIPDRGAIATRCYRQALRLLARYLGHRPTVADLSPDMLAGFMRDLHARGYRRHNIDKVASYITALWSLARQQKLTAVNPPSPRYRMHPTIPGMVVRPKPKPRGRQSGNRQWPGALMAMPKSIDDTLRSHFLFLYRPKKLFGKSPETVRLYGYTFDYFAQFLGREAVLSDLTDDRVMALMEWLTRVRCLSARTANKTRDQLCALWRYLARKQIVAHWPDVANLIEPQRAPVAWTREELATLWDLCTNQRGRISGIPAGAWWIALHAVAWDSLERVGAVRQILWSDFSADLRWLHIRSETRKGRVKDHTAKMHATTVALLEAIREPSRELVFPWHQNACYFWTRYKRMRESVGLPVDRQHSFHALRRTGASFADAAGADATRLLGHSTRAVTVKHYLDPRLCGEVHAADVLFRPGAEGGAA